MFEHILDTKYDQAETSGGDTWSNGLFVRLNTLLDQLVTLMRVCIGGSAARASSSMADEHIVQFCIRTLRDILSESSHMNIGSFFGMFEGYVQSKIQQILLNINLERSLVDEFIVHKKSQHELETEPEPEPSGPVDDDQYDSASSTLSGHSIDMDQHFSQHEKDKAKEKEDATTSDLGNANMPIYIENANLMHFH